MKNISEIQELLEEIAQQSIWLKIKQNFSRLLSPIL